MTDNNSKYIIREFYNFSADKNLILEAEAQNKPIILSGILQKANTLNRNGRVYPYEILKREADKYIEAVDEGRALGQLDHPTHAIVELQGVSHKIIDMWWQGEELYGKIQILEDECPNAKILKGLLKSGVMLGISSRGVGSVKSKGGQDIVQDDFELICFDIVSSPSTPGAYMFKESRDWGMTPLVDASRLSPKNLQEEINKYVELNKLLKNNFWENL